MKCVLFWDTLQHIPGWCSVLKFHVTLIDGNFSGSFKFPNTWKMPTLLVSSVWFSETLLCNCTDTDHVNKKRRGMMWILAEDQLSLLRFIMVLLIPLSKWHDITLKQATKLPPTFLPIHQSSSYYFLPRATWPWNMIQYYEINN